MRELEAEPSGLDQGALLRHMRAQHLAQRLVQEMRRRMMRTGGRGASMIDRERDLLTQLQRARLDHAVVQEQAVQLLLRVLDGEARAPGAPAGAPVARPVGAVWPATRA